MTALQDSVFTRTNHLFLRNPRGGVEDVMSMAAAGFGAIYCNIGDFPLPDWEVIRSRAVAADVECGPWLRTAEGGDGAFDPDRVGFLIDVADEWGTSFIVNTEAEADHSGKEITEFIAEEVGDRDAALSMQPWPFASVDWRPVGHLPILPQIFGAQWGIDAEAARAEWFRVGAQCVVDTFGTYAINGVPAEPSWYDRFSPYGLYTADDCANNFARWGSLGTQSPYPSDGPAPIPPTNGGSMEKIGEQHGITAMANLFREQWPDKTGKPDPNDHTTWKAIDKWERQALMLVQDHDAQVSQ